MANSCFYSMTNHRKQGVSVIACFNSYLGLKRVPSEFPVMQQQVSWATKMSRLTSDEKCIHPVNIKLFCEVSNEYAAVHIDYY